MVGGLTLVRNTPRVQVFGGKQVSIDGPPYAPQNHMLYEGVLTTAIRTSLVHDQVHAFEHTENA